MIDTHANQKNKKLGSHPNEIENLEEVEVVDVPNEDKPVVLGTQEVSIGVNDINVNQNGVKPNQEKAGKRHDKDDLDEI